MIQLERGVDLFSLRVAGVALRRRRVLIHRSVDDDFWCLPGGRAEFGESASATLCREIQEELGVDVEVERLLFVVENFFPHDARNFHELGLYFQMRPPEDWEHLDAAGAFQGHEGGVPVEFRWHPLDRLDEIVLYPRFLRSELLALPDAPRHVVEVEEALIDHIETRGSVVRS
jgi:8-oxo-dGTP pyrophosphatase MutT (NUDIX family)